MSENNNIENKAAPKIPTSFWEYVRSFGPGFVIVLTWLGSGDIVSAGVSGANYGYALMWAMVVALLMRFFFVSTIAKYQMCNIHNEGLLDGLVRLHPFYAPFLLIVIAIIGHINGTYMIAGIGETMSKLTGVGPDWMWGIVWVIIGLLVVFRPLYDRAEWVFKIFIVLMTISLVGSALWVGPNITGIIKGTIAFDIPEQQGPFGAMAVAMAMIGAVGGSLLNLVYPYFLEQKGWKGPKYRKLQTYDFILAIVALIIFNLAVWTLGAELVRESGKNIGNLEDLTALLGLVLGEGGRKLFLLGMFGAVFTSLLGNGLGLGYLASHAFFRWRNPKSTTKTPDYRKYPIYKITALWIMVSPFVWILTGKADFVTLTLLANTLMAVLIPALAGGLWWITANSRYIGTEYKNKLWENLIMGFLFALAIWGAWESALSVIDMVTKMMS